jgi:hypothetical protein
VGKYKFLDNIFGTDDEEETEANNDFYDDDAESEDDGNEGEEEGDDDDLPEEDEAGLARLDREFRKQRGQIRSATDLSALRTMRAEYAAALGERQSPTVRLRTQDLIEEIDARVTDIRASRGPRSS